MIQPIIFSLHHHSTLPKTIGVQPLTPLIGALNEGPLHKSLKQLYALPNDCVEEPVGRYIADIKRKNHIIEIQTASFAPLKKKLKALLADYRVTLVTPVACERWLIKLPKSNQHKQTRRKSPKHASVENIFEKLVSIPDLIKHPGFELEVLVIEEEEVRAFDASRAWRRRRGWQTVERRLVNVLGRRVFKTADDLLTLIPGIGKGNLVAEFSTSDIAEAMSSSRELAQQAAYCLRAAGVIEATGKRGNTILYSMPIQ